MKFRLKQLIVKNFKAFKSRSINFESKNLILLDGPNGFGKTSFYDALELLFIGKVQRYINIEEQTVYGRKSAKTYPLMFDRAEKSESVIIQLLLELESGELITLKRSAQCSELMELKQLNDANFQLEVYEGDQKVEFSDENKVLTHLLGDNYLHNYNLFYYIEQEENTAFLKCKATNKQDKIDHLFDVAEYRGKIDKLERVRKVLSPLKTESKKNKLASLNSDILNLEKEASYSGDKLEVYSRLINITEQAWDKESVMFEAGSYAYWLGDNGDLEKISQLKKAEMDFANNRYNVSIKQEFSLIPRVMQPLLRFGHRVENIPKYQYEIELYESSTNYLAQIEKGAFKLIIGNTALPAPNLVSVLGNKIDFSLMSQSIKDIQAKNGTSTKLTQSLNKLIASHEVYISEYKQYQALHDEKETLCPTCGHDWIKLDVLNEQFEKQKEALTSLLDGQSTIIQTSLHIFDKNFIEVIKIECEKIIREQKSIVAYKKAICSLAKEQQAFLTKLKLKYAEHNIDISDLYAKTLSIDEELKLTQLEEKISSRYKPVKYEALKPEFDDLFKAIFNENIEELNKLELGDIERKVNYLKQKFAESRLHELNEKNKTYREEKRKFDDAIQLDRNLKKLYDLYNENINNYISSISKGIEILFHIYSGRLLQNFQNGLGVFIDTDGKSVSFKDTPDSEHDVIFSMSSGQLSSLTIAFTLALNHRYARNDLLLIDDPVQTMDEINVAGFIDLLRYQFKNRQIFISTHEDHTSSYFRYKFSKAGLEQERINFKELSKIETENN
jgi:energy-coupling factor transporter ATP-binding protein EcfA2